MTIAMFGPIVTWKVLAVGGVAVLVLAIVIVAATGRGRPGR
jgi:hypothetical protein